MDRGPTSRAGDGGGANKSVVWDGDEGVGVGPRAVPCQALGI